MTTSILKPTSRGSVTLRSARPDAKPRIHHNYLATEDDRATLIASVRLAMDLFAQPNLSKVQRVPFSIPASDAEADIVALSSSEQARTIIRHLPARSVASSTLISGFSAQKPSVMPSIVRGNTNAAVIPIAEAAHILLGNEPRQGVVITF